MAYIPEGNQTLESGRISHLSGTPKIQQRAYINR
jgi:hypothetical protein